MKVNKKVALLLDAGRSFDRGLLRGIAQYVNLHRPWVFIRPSAFYERFSGFAKQSLEEIRRSKPDGLIMNYSPLEEEVAALGVPVIDVPVGRIVPGVCHILCDNREAAAMAADHFLRLGLRHFAYAGFEGTVWSIERKDSFSSRLQERGFAVDSHLVPLVARDRDKPRLEAALARWLKNLPKPVGIMACNDEFARSLAELCRLQSLRVPDEAALIGVDNDSLVCELCSPPISSVAYATEHAGYEAAELLDRLMTGRKRTRQDIPVHASHVVARQSTDLLAIRDEEVVTALRFMRDNVGRIIQVRDVVEATGLSHRTLHTRFRRAVGRSLVQEMNRQRAHHIARLLATTNEPVKRIAQNFGYLNVAHLSRFFHHEMGMSPRAYRMMQQSPTGAVSADPMSGGRETDSG
jgi:LacI family transcriptional regulator